jgi:hypothetical protein
MESHKLHAVALKQVALSLDEARRERNFVPTNPFLCNQIASALMTSRRLEQYIYLQKLTNVNDQCDETEAADALVVMADATSPTPANAHA